MILRPYQQTAVDWTFEYMEAMKGNPCICLPTGAGKTIVIAEIINRIGSDKSILLLSHRKEILEQNYETIRRLMPLAPIGIYSASLGKKTINRITLAQVQSFAKKSTNMFFEFDYILPDECHLIPKSGEGQYRTILKANPKARVIGLTATPIRLDSGSIVGKDNILTHFSYEANINELIADGYLSPLVGKSSVVQADLSDVKKQGREYILSQAMMAINQDALTLGAVQECLKYGEDRKHWIVFCSGVEHAENVGKCLEREGISNHVITGDTIAMLREKYINEFKAGKVRALINCDVLTTGFDAPCVDLIVLLRATMSTALYVQMLGRGSRITEGKTDCLVLDFCGNLEKHGPIDKIKYTTHKNESTGEGEAPGKICPECRSLCATAVKDCPDCGFVFPERLINHDVVASSASPLSREFDKPFELIIDNIEFDVVESKKTGIEMVSIVYWTKYGQDRVSELLLFNHSGFAKEKSERWYRANTVAVREGIPVPTNVDEAYVRISHEMFWPKSLWVKRTTGKYYDIVSRNNTKQTVRKKKLELEEELC